MSSRRPISWVALSLIGALSLLMGVLAGSSLLFPRYEAQAVIGLMALVGKGPCGESGGDGLPSGFRDLKFSRSLVVFEET